MAGERLTGSEKRALFLWVVLGILGALFACKYFFRAFPEASVNFKVSREEALARALNFVTGRADLFKHLIQRSQKVVETRAGRRNLKAGSVVL